MWMYLENMMLSERSQTQKKHVVMLIVGVNLTGLRKVWIAGKTFLGVSVQMFLEEISI